ncbi:MAG: hypothetical protein IPH03_09140 [Tetrasphaera sp.]|jgi:hypothetical protein|nr:hypothetical protein [Tetrasphaera sp.]
MAEDSQDSADDSARAETELVAGLVSAVKSHDGPLDEAELDAALGVTRVDGSNAAQPPTEPLAD